MTLTPGEKRKRSLHIVGICAIIVIIIGIYGSYRCANPDYHDILMSKFNVFDLDGWSVTHFVLFCVLGYFYPEQINTAMTLGISWELFEHTIGKNRPAFLGGFGDCETTDPNVGNWWFGRVSDIVVNYAGFKAGALLRKNIGH